MYHFVGIKGSGMSALAQILFELGYEVQGSDVETHFFTEDKLHELGIKILPFDEKNIKPNMKIVRGATFNDEHPEIKKAKELDLPVFEYADMLGSLTKKFKSICVSGCHGKTTTTAMFAHTFGLLKGINYLIGDGTGYANPENEYFALESCEYRRHFLNYNPYYAIITNIDYDHVDYYKNIDDVIDAYTSFANKAEKMVIACGDDRYTHSLELNVPIFYYGIDEDNDIIAKDIIYKEDGISFEVEAEGNFYGTFDLPIFGKHMLLDALAVISTCYYERFDAKEVCKALKTFKGAKRRFTETIVNDNIIIDDYAHHPNEVKATIKAAKQKYSNKKIVAIFEPHTFSRTNAFYKELAEVLNSVNEAYILPIHPAREKQEDFPEVTSQIIVDELNNGHLMNEKDIDKLGRLENTVFLFMSPNDVSNIENKLIELLNS